MFKSLKDNAGERLDNTLLKRTFFRTIQPAFCKSNICSHTEVFTESILLKNHRHPLPADFRMIAGLEGADEGTITNLPKICGQCV